MDDENKGYEPVYIDETVNIGGTNYNIPQNSKGSVDTVTLIIKGTKVVISGNNLTVNVE